MAYPIYQNCEVLSPISILCLLVRVAVTVDGRVFVTLAVDVYLYSLLFRGRNLPENEEMSFSAVGVSSVIHPVSTLRIHRAISTSRYKYITLSIRHATNI